MNSILCFLFGHRYRVTRRINSTVSELVCIRCKKEFGINTEINTILPLDADLREAHKVIMGIYE